MGVMDRRRQIMLNEPHLAVTTPAGVANFSTDMVGKLAQCKVEFSPVQASGTPSPSNVLPISGWTGVNVTRAGANLIDDSKRFSNTESIFLGQTTSGYSLPLKAGKYTLSVDYVDGYATKAFYKKQGGTGVQIWDRGTSSATFTISADGNYQIYLYRTSIDATKVGNCWLNYGETASPYSAYTGTTYPISWTDHGTVYGGYVDLASGTLVRTWGSYTVSANTPFYKAGANRPDFLYINEAVGMLPFYSAAGRWTGYCDMIKVITTRSRTQIETLFGTYESSTFYDRIYIYDLNKTFTSITTSDEAIAKLKELAPTFVFPLQNVQTYQLTPKQIKTLGTGVNNIWSNANGDITIKYWKH